MAALWVTALDAGQPALAAGAVEVAIVTEAGAPVEHAVVWLETDLTAAPGASPTAVMNQINQQFVPFVLPVAVGTKVDFPNNDPFRHHVYSFSAAKSFELKLYGGGEVQTVTFDVPGPVALGCNIHDNMLGYVYAVASPFFATTDGKGVARLTQVPAGTYPLRVWHPSQKTDAAPVAITIAEGGVLSERLTVAVRPDRRGRRPGAYDERGY